MDIIISLWVEIGEMLMTYVTDKGEQVSDDHVHQHIESVRIPPEAWRIAETVQ